MRQLNGFAVGGDVGYEVEVKLGADKPEIISKLENLRPFLSLKPLLLLQLDPLTEQTTNWLSALCL